MVTLTKEQVMAKVKYVADMTLDELEEYGVKVSMSDIDAKAKYFIYKAIDCKKLEIKEMKRDAFVTNGDIDDMEFNV